MISNVKQIGTVGGNRILYNRPQVVMSINRNCIAKYNVFGL